MQRQNFERKVKKQLWFLNRKEKTALETVLAQDMPEEVYKKPIAFSNQYLKRYIFREGRATTTHFFLILLGLMVTNIILLGGFLFGLITSLTSARYFIQPQASLSIFMVILIAAGAFLLMLVCVFLIKATTAYYTKKLLEYKFNRAT